jgi:glycosyltransferase involved in cell wall biosynthesis
MASAEFHSIVAPVYNEEDVLREFQARLSSALTVLPAYEAILVDDGSTDSAAAMLAEISVGDARWKCDCLARNFGQQMAMTAGIDFARGDTVAVIDADLQDPPELIPRMVEEWRQGADVVFAVRDSRRGERWPRGSASSV